MPAQWLWPPSLPCESWPLSWWSPPSPWWLSLLWLSLLFVVVVVTAAVVARVLAVLVLIVPGRGSHLGGRRQERRWSYRRRRWRRECRRCRPGRRRHGRGSGSRSGGGSRRWNRRRRCPRLIGGNPPPWDREHGWRRDHGLRRRHARRHRHRRLDHGARSRSRRRGWGRDHEGLVCRRPDVHPHDRRRESRNHDRRGRRAREAEWALGERPRPEKACRGVEEADRGRERQRGDRALRPGKPHVIPRSADNYS